MKKVYGSAAEALEGVLFDGMFIASGGFGLCGIPELLLEAIKVAGTKNLTFASNMFLFGDAMFLFARPLL